MSQSHDLATLLADNQPVPPPPAGPPAKDYSPLALVALTLIFLGLCIVLAVPFLPAITWGVALAILAWPMHRWISVQVKRPVLASLLSTIAVVIIVVVPIGFVFYQLTSQAAALATQMPAVSGQSPILEKMAEAPGIGRVVQWMERMGFQVEAEVHKLIRSFAEDVPGLAQGSLAAAIQILMAIFILYHLFLDRGTFLRATRDLLPLTRTETDAIFLRAADSVHANLYATAATSLIDAIGGGVMFWMLGLPAPLLWAVVMFILALLPIVGAALVWVPAVIFLALTDRWLEALALLGWGVTFFVLVDNILYTRLAGQRMRMHAVPTLIAFLGGIAVFGLSGMILGPAIVAVTTAFLQVWKTRLQQTNKVVLK